MIAPIVAKRMIKKKLRLESSRTDTAAAGGTTTSDGNGINELSIAMMAVIELGVRSEELGVIESIDSIDSIEFIESIELAFNNKLLVISKIEIIVSNFFIII